MGAPPVFSIFFVIVPILCLGLLAKIQIYNNDGHMNPTLYVVHMRKKKIKASGRPLG